MPPPLQNSQKCVRCSLAGICLPDEIALLKGMEYERKEATQSRIRRLLPSRDNAIPVYVVGQGNTVIMNVSISMIG